MMHFLFVRHRTQTMGKAKGGMKDEKRNKIEKLLHI